MPRQIDEWIGKHDDAAIPARVKVRVLDRQRPAPRELPICPDCGMPIREGDGCEFDHAVPLIDGGRHAESNLRAIHTKCHRRKTAREAMERAEARTHVKKAFDLSKPRGRPLAGTRASGIRRRMSGKVEHW